MAMGFGARTIARTVLTLAVAVLSGCVPALRMANVPSPEAPGFFRTIAAVSSSTITRGRATGFWYHPDAIYAERLKAVRQARRTLHFETYYMTPGKRADAFAQALIARSRAGVKVRFLADADGVKLLSAAYWRRLRAAKVEVRFYHPLEWHRPWLYNTRTHRKLLLVDGRVAFTGGTGVSDHWDGHAYHPQAAPWADTEVRLEGAVVGMLEGVFAQHWTDVGGRADLSPAIFHAHDANDPRMLVNASSPSDGDSPVRALYYASMLSARKRIWIASPYFLPSRAARQELLAAKRRGVDVRILSVGPRNDQGLIYEAVREQSRALVAGGVSILEYQPAMMHAKTILIDDRWVVTGSANFDPRSFYHNDELTIGAEDPALAAQVEAFFLDAFADSRALTPEALDGRDGWCRAQGQLTLLFKWFL
jgi:cardiolipin synthase